MGASRRTRAHAAIANAATPEVRARRAALLSEKDRANQIRVAEEQVARAQEALEFAQTLTREKGALKSAEARLAELKSVVRPSVLMPASAHNIDSGKKVKAN